MKNHPSVTRNTRDSTIDCSTFNAARLFGQIAENTVHNRDVVNNQLNREKATNRVRREDADADDDDNDDNNNNDDKKDNNDNGNNDKTIDSDDEQSKC